MATYLEYLVDEVVKTIERKRIVQHEEILMELKQELNRDLFLFTQNWNLELRPVELPPDEDEENCLRSKQTSGGRCRNCKNFTTYTRQNSETGLCLKCETEKEGRR